MILPLTGLSMLPSGLDSRPLDAKTSGCLQPRNRLNGALLTPALQVLTGNWILPRWL